MVFDAIMACDEDRAAPLQRDDVVRSVEAIQILNVVAGDMPGRSTMSMFEASLR